MDETLLKLAALAKGRDSHVACAAAVVLAELAPRDQEVAAALGAAVDMGDATRRPLAIEALGRIGTPATAGVLASLIRAGGSGAEEALRAVAHAGHGALKPLLGILEDAPPGIRRNLVEAIARAGDARGFAALLDRMCSRDPSVVQAARDGLRQALGGLSANGRQTLLKELNEALGRKAFAACEPACVGALELAGALGALESLSVLLKFIGAQRAPAVRRAALLALGKLNLDPHQRGELAGRLLPLLEEGDGGQVVEPALAALRGASLGAQHRPALHRLLDSPHARVREFAMQALAAQKSARSLADLLACLDSTDPNVAAEAGAALAQTPQAAAPLAKRLLAARDPETSRRLGEALARQAAALPRALLGKLVRAYLAGAAPAAQAQALLAVLRASATAELAAAALKDARRLRSSGEPHRAQALLKGISGVQGWTDDHRVELALAGLSATPPDLSRAARLEDPHLRLLEGVLQSGRVQPKSLAGRICRDRALSRRALYLLGFHFSERLLAERDFGREVLLKLAAQRRTEEGRQAREKLVLEGLVKAPAKVRKGLLEVRAQALRAADELAGRLAAEEQAGRRPPRKARAGKAPRRRRGP